MEKHLPLNLITNILVFLLSTLIGVFITPFLLRHLDTDGYGILKLVMSLPMIITLFTLVISGGISRFLSIDLQKRNFLEANITFNSFFWGLTFIIIFISPILIYFILNLTEYFDIPIAYSNTTKYLCVGIFLSSLFNIYSTAFNIPAFSENRLDIINYTKIFSLLTQNILIVLLLTHYSNHLLSIAFSYFVSGLLGLLLSTYIWRKFSPELILNIKLITKNKIYELSRFGRWLIIDHLGTMLFIYLDLIIINVLLGSLATGEYSIPLQWQMLLKSLMFVFAAVVIPLIYRYYSNNNYKMLRQIAHSSIKYLSLIISIPIGILCGFGSNFFTLWIGEEYLRLIPLLWLMIIPLLFSLPVTVLFYVNSAYNRIKIPALFTVFFGALHLITGIILIKYFNSGIYGLAISSSALFTFRNTIFTVMYTNKLLESSLINFYKNYIFGICNFLLIIFLSSIIVIFIKIDNSWLLMFLSILSVTIFSIIFIYYLMLDINEKEYLLKMLKRESSY
ncbi:MAG: lipopolysaccharide biosynthesis protein [Ignavibacteriae bacterium]|nr:lipopolysaccharide biosynthesis protein [Ignavibacteriota bacterium]